MNEFVGAIGAAFGVVFLAELGDKTQLLALGFGARHRLRVVVIGLFLGFGAAGAIATLVGAVLGATLPERPIAIGAGLLFIAFAIATLVGNGDDDESAKAIRAGSVVASIAITIALAEMGDKTQLATAALAARGNPVGTWIGATAAEVCAAMIGAFAGQRIGTRFSERSLRYASAVIFAGFGVVLLLTA